VYPFWRSSIRAPVLRKFLSMVPPSN